MVATILRSSAISFHKLLADQPQFLPAFCVWAVLEGWRGLRSGTSAERAQALLLGFCLLQIAFVVSVSSLFSSIESARYRYTVEHSVHVRAGRRGSGLGQALMQPLIARARALGKHVMMAGVDADNAGSIRFHERLGFERVAHLREVGFKFGRRLDLVFLQRLL